MAVRYCGTLRINVRVISDAYYKVSVTVYSGYTCQTTSVNVDFPKCLTACIDSPEAYDSAAHAGLSFLADEGVDLEGVDITDRGWGIRRRKDVCLINGPEYVGPGIPT